MTTTIVSGIFLFLPVLLGILGVAIFSAKKNVESKNKRVMVFNNFGIMLIPIGLYLIDKEK